MFTELSGQQPRQLKLFEVGTEQQVTPLEEGGSCFSDPSFASNKTQPVHRWVPWIAGFSSKFVRDALSRYLSGKGIVLDPFCGVGTTLVEAVLLGHRTVGFEINPYAVLACRIKLQAGQIALDELYHEIARFQSFYSDSIASAHTPKSTPPAGFKTRSEFYSPKVLRKVLLVQDFIATIADPRLQDLFRLAFASTMVRYSNYSYEPSLGRRKSAGKPDIEDFPVGRVITEKLLEMAEDIAWFQEALPGKSADWHVFNDSFFAYHKYLSPESVDLIITSPPYLNNYHYNRNTRPQLYWLGYVKHPRDLKTLEHSNFGKYWQTVREQAKLELAFSLPNTDIEEQIQTLRKINREKGIYGGNGWANYAVAYFNDCYAFAKAIDFVLKPNATALVVIGNSILQGIMIPTDYYFAKIAESIGLEIVRIDVPRATRVGNSIIQSDARVAGDRETQRLYEAVVELRKRPT
ncbi:MAG: DNA methyltransferase [Anaerolineae bacterium]|nr:DNA methyltransferase [Anaerolineae bacterium]